MGYVPETLLPAVYKASDLFALVSDCEVQSIPTLQALAAGVPVVAANAAALPELVKHGVNGYLVPPDDPASVSQAVLQLLSDRPRASKMGREGIEIARKHSDVKILNEFENLYRALTNHH
jgi:glycosyltransferase involved in cell wall biosynthesis